MSYQQKSIWASLIATLFVVGRFAATDGKSVAVTVTLLVIIQVIAQIAIAIGTRPEPKDERDKMIEAKGYRIGYLVLILGVIVCMNRAGAMSAGALIMALLTAEIGKSVTQLISYHRGA